MELIRRGEALTLAPEPAPTQETIVVNTGGRYEPTGGVTPRGTTGYSRKLPWGAGRAVAAYTNAETRYGTTREAMKAEGLDWDVELGPLFANDMATGGYLVAEGWRTVQRSDTSKVLGVVKGRYEPILNRRLAEFNDVLVKETGGQQAAVGSAFDDKRVYAVTRLDDIDSPDGGLGVFLITANSHDGGTSMSSTVAAVRWACTNGLVGLHDKAHTVKIRHTIKAEERIEEALRIMAGVSTYLDDTTRLMEELLRTPVPPTAVEQLIPVPRRTDDNQRAVRSATKRQDELLATWKHSDNLADVRNTGWGFVNAVAEWNEWTGSHVSRRRRTPMERLLADTGQDIVREARDLVLAG